MYGPLQNKMEILMARNITIIKSILVAHGLQMVIADFALMALLLAQPGQIDLVLEPSAIQFNDQSLTVATPDPHSSIFIVRNVNCQLGKYVNLWISFYLSFIFAQRTRTINPFGLLSVLGTIKYP